MFRVNSNPLVLYKLPCGRSSLARKVMKTQLKVQKFCQIGVFAVSILALGLEFDASDIGSEAGMSYNLVH